MCAVYYSSCCLTVSNLKWSFLVVDIPSPLCCLHYEQKILFRASSLMHKPFSPVLPSFLKKSSTFLFIFLFPYVFVDNWSRPLDRFARSDTFHVAKDAGHPDCLGVILLSMGTSRKERNT